MASSLVVLKFDSPEGADKGLELAISLQKQQLLQLLDAAIVTWPQGKKKPKTRHLGDMTAAGAVDGAFWGMLFGFLFFVPFFGAALKASTTRSVVTCPTSKNSAEVPSFTLPRTCSMNSRPMP